MTLRLTELFWEFGAWVGEASDWQMLGPALSHHLYLRRHLEYDRGQPAYREASFCCCSTRVSDIHLQTSTQHCSHGLDLTFDLSPAC